VAGTVTDGMETVGGTADIVAGTEVDTTGTGTTTPGITAGTAAGATSLVDTIRGGCFRFPFLTRTMGVMVQATDMGMDRVTGTDID
jgi:hypothetical protein